MYELILETQYLIITDQLSNRGLKKQQLTFEK